MQKLLKFFQQNMSIYAIFNDQSFNNALTNDISFEQLGTDKYFFNYFSPKKHIVGIVRKYTKISVLVWLKRSALSRAMNSISS